MKSIKRILSYTVALLMTVGINSGIIEPTLTSDNYVSGITGIYAAEISAAEIVTFTFSDSEINAIGSESGYTITGTALTITQSGTYRLTGECADGTVEIKKELAVTLILDNLTLTSATTAPFIFGASTDVIISATGTNTLSDTAGSNADGSVIKSKNTSTLTLCGNGTLNLFGKEKNGIKGAADTRVIVDSLTLNVEAVNNALASDGAVIINDGKFNLNSGNDAIKSEPDIMTEFTGTITVNGGEITIVSAGDGIAATNLAVINGGTFNITTGGGYKAVIGVDDSAKGIKGGNAVQITNGNFYLNCADDAIHSANVTVEGGEFTIYSADDALHADYILNVGVLGNTGPVIDILVCYEGFEGAEIYLYSGSCTMIASDDGINAANGDLSNYSFKISVYGGNWYVNAGGDGIDSNGDIYLYGGIIESFGSSGNGDAALDFDGKCYAEGGTLLAVGTSGMAQSPSSGVFVGFGVNSSGGGMRPGSQGSSSINITSGNTVEIKNSTGDVVYSAASVKTANTVILASLELVSGQTYYLYVNGTQVSSTTASGVATTPTTTTATSTSTSTTTTSKTTATTTNFITTVITTTVTSANKIGDINLDYEVSTADLIMLAKHICSRLTLSGQGLINADCSSTPGINSEDLLALIKYMVGEIETLPI